MRLLHSAAVFLLSSTANATVVCYTVFADLSDSGRVLIDGVTTEDYWTSSAFEAVRGANYTIRANSPSGGLMSSGYLGDGTTSAAAGCSASFTIPSGTTALWVQLKSLGYVRDNLLRVRNDEAAGKPFDLHEVTLTASQIAQPIVTINATHASLKRSMWNAYAVSAYALYRSAGGLTGTTFTVDVYTSSCLYTSASGACQTSFFDGSAVKLKQTFGTNRKFIIVHELGHHLYRNAGITIGSDCSLASSVCPESDGAHSMASKEIQSCAYNEGAAHFYAARVWNTNAETNCEFAYYKSEFGLGSSSIAFDCEGTGSAPRIGSPPQNAFPSNFLETVCGGTLSNRGVEADWLRALWDVYTNGNSPPSFPSIVDWMHDAFAFSLPSDTPYSNLNYEANVVGGSLDTNWDATAAFNGVAQP